LCGYSTYHEARKEFRKKVGEARFDGDHSDVVRVALIRVRRLGGAVETRHEWVREPADLKETVEVKYGFKIHGFQTANGLAYSANTEKFYSDYDTARDAAEQMCRGKEHPGVVIYKAVQLIRPVQPQIEVEHIDL
jgi:hypothetical protein